MSSDKTTANKRRLGVTAIMGIAIAAISLWAAAMHMGQTYGSPDSVWRVFWLFCAVVGAVVAGGFVAEFKIGRSDKLQLETKRQRLLDIVFRYNAVTKMLQQSYEDELQDNKLTRWNPLGIGSTARQKEQLRQQYEKKYYQNKAAYAIERQRFIDEWSQTEKPSPVSRMWKWLIAAGIFTQVLACSYTLGAEIDDAEDTPDVEVADGETPQWTAATIPMPHLTDGRLYVSNPDGVVSEQTVDRLNRTLRLMDDSLGIESVVVVVNHVADQDIFRFAQDIFDTYKVGKDDRGLVMVLAYEDHLFRTHTGRSLEADLTDVECFRLQEEYLVPSMRQAMPDSGMIYMVEATYNLLQGKDMPVMQLSSDDEGDVGPFPLYFMIVIGWFALWAFLSHRHGWNSNAYGSNLFYPNPFQAPSQSSGFYVGSGGHCRGGGFGGGGFGGGFSGGSSGGGGATSSW